jgi:hypothetical protein
MQERVSLARTAARISSKEKAGRSKGKALIFLSPF